MGNGLSNQTFIEAPDGIIAIDTGESIEEMADALAELRRHTDRPIAAVLYTHFHYVSGTAAVLDGPHTDPLPVWAHERVAVNRSRAATEIAPAYGRGIAEQFGVTLPTSGADALVNVGLGHFFRNPAHAPFRDGHLAANHTFAGDTIINVAGLDIEVTHAPSDADDSVTYWFPTLGVCVNNLVWPLLFNIFAIRGEEYRDPRVLLRGLDHLLSLHADHLVGAHGPVISGRAEIAARVTNYRDSIQYLWDQTVRHINLGATSRELAHLVTLPECFADDYLTSELYGVAEHHTRQIQTGLFGWFDGDEANLFPLEPTDRCNRLIHGFGGRENVRAQASAAMKADDLRWAVELASWLVRSDDVTDGDRRLLAAALRTIAQRTPAANIRNWCLARARGLDGSEDRSRFYVHRLNKRQLAMASPADAVHVLRVLLEPTRALGVDVHVAWEFADGSSCGLHIRNCVACPTDGAGASITVSCTRERWIAVVTGAITLSDALAAGDLGVIGNIDELVAALNCFDVASLRTDA
jgi:alkyl sulfatase BDS1-like metallo-beta-lactamase superfamily hydrolase